MPTCTSSIGGSRNEKSTPRMPGVRENRCSPTATRPAIAKCVTSARPVMLATSELVDRILGASCEEMRVNGDFDGLKQGCYTSSPARYTKACISKLQST